MRCSDWSSKGHSPTRRLQEWGTCPENSGGISQTHCGHQWEVGEVCCICEAVVSSSGRSMILDMIEKMGEIREPFEEDRFPVSLSYLLPDDSGLSDDIDENSGTTDS